MKQAALITLLALAIGLAHIPAYARTWRVEKDGSGDFTAIQPALDSAAAGDTVLIGPGRFTETEEVVVPGWTEDVYAVVRSDSVSIIGSGVYNTVIGPSEKFDIALSDRPKGILAYDISLCRVSGLTVENIHDCFFFECSVEIGDCIIRRGGSGIVLILNGHSIVISDMLIEDCEESGIIAWGPCSSMRISGCNIYDNGMGIVLNNIDDITIEECLFDFNYVTIQFDSSSGEVRDCTMSNGRNADIVSIGSHMTLTSCQLSNAYTAIHADTWGMFYGSGNVIPPGEAARIVVGGTSFEFHGNHILRSDSEYIRLSPYVNPPADILDFSGNYWGTTEADTLSEWIWDGNDDPNILDYVCTVTVMT